MIASPFPIGPQTVFVLEPIGVEPPPAGRAMTFQAAWRSPLPTDPNEPVIAICMGKARRWKADAWLRMLDGKVGTIGAKILVPRSLFRAERKNRV